MAGIFYIPLRLCSYKNLIYFDTLQGVQCGYCPRHSTLCLLYAKRFGIYIRCKAVGLYWVHPVCLFSRAYQSLGSDRLYDKAACMKACFKHTKAPQADKLSLRCFQRFEFDCSSFRVHRQWQGFFIFFIFCFTDLNTAVVTAGGVTLNDI